MEDNRSIVGEPKGVEPSARLSWLEQHLQGFVKPYLGFIPVEGIVNPFTPHEMSVIKNLWRHVKREANGLPILLAGRDVFIFEILAQREHFPTVFRPDISRLTVEHIKEDYSRHYLFDTGFAGSIPRALRCKFFSMASSGIGMGLGIPWSYKPLSTSSKQVFPRMTGSRSLALKIESMPKYWRRGFYREDKGIQQDPSDAVEFLNAARLTIAIYKDSSPKFSDGKLETAKLSQLLGWSPWTE